MIELLCLVKKFQLVTFLYMLPFSLYSIGNCLTIAYYIDTISINYDSTSLINIHTILYHNIRNLFTSTAYPSLYRWYMTCIHHPKLGSILEKLSLSSSSSSFYESSLSFGGDTKWGRGRIRVKELLALGAGAIGNEVGIQTVPIHTYFMNGTTTTHHHQIYS